ncbi:flagellar biosynthesis protein FlhF [Castellaniella sp. GW247-6E4]|uniref:flagellar biosynthesis protein FlhF n=1 Tax=Castellaniella sp. GW247-6E4 TaxID=3140380 RepID=UPI003315C6D5
MNISRFFGITNREAMRQVRLALGPDALIVSNKRVNGGVEILATDQTPAPAHAADQAPPPTPPARPAARPVAPSAPGQDLIGAIGELRGSLESRIDELLWGSQLRRAPGAVSLFQTLLRFGFSTALLRAMLKRLPEHMGERAAFQWARAELVKHLPVLASEDTLWQPGLALALVGPTGVGKTTTIAKLAARCVRRAGPDGLILLTTDTYRIGAHEQLKIYGQMLRVPVHVVQDIHEMRRVVQSARPDQTILVDNVGISQRDQYISEQAALLASAERPVSRLLVLNASSHGDTLDEVARSYAGDGGTPLRGCIITKIDEASRLGAALDTAIRYQLPIHYVSNGQKVPEHLLFLPTEALVDHALAPAQGGRTLYAPTEADLAALLSMTRPAEGGDAAAAQRQRDLLPRLLTLSAQDGEALAAEDLRAAVAALDEDPVLAEGYELWRAQGRGDESAVAEGVERLRSVARRELGAAGGLTLAVHGRIALHLGSRRGAWLASAWCGLDGRALAATSQQLVLAEGWYSPIEAHRPVAPTQADALLAQITAESAAAASPLLHVFEGGAPTLWRTLESRGVHWLAQCGARTRVHELGGGPATLSAVCRRLTVQPLDPKAFAHRPAFVGLDDARVAFWVGTGRVGVRTRGFEPLEARAVCLRAIDRQDGRELRCWYALATPQGPEDPIILAQALAARVDCHAAWRLAAAMLGDTDGPGEAMLTRSLRAAQLGLAAWRLWRDPRLAQAAAVCARMLGQDVLRPVLAPAALDKLYTLKEVLG